MKINPVSCLFVTFMLYFFSLFMQANSFLPGMDVMKSMPENMMKKTHKFLKGFKDFIPMQLNKDKDSEKSSEEEFAPTEPLRPSRRKREVSTECDGKDRVAEQAMMRTLEIMQSYDPLELGSTLMGNLEEGTMLGFKTLSNATPIKVSCDSAAVTIETVLKLDTMNITYVWIWNVLAERIGKAWMNGERVKFALTAIIDRDQMKPYVVLSMNLMNTAEEFDIGYSGLEPFQPPMQVVSRTIYDDFKHNTIENIEEVILEVFSHEYLKVMHEESVG